MITSLRVLQYFQISNRSQASSFQRAQNGGRHAITYSSSINDARMLHTVISRYTNIRGLRPPSMGAIRQS